MRAIKPSYFQDNIMVDKDPPIVMPQLTPQEILPIGPSKRIEKFKKALVSLCDKHNAELFVEYTPIGIAGLRVVLKAAPGQSEETFILNEKHKLKRK